LETPTSPSVIVVQKAIIEEVESKLRLVEIENKQLHELNRKLTDDLMRYTYKDKLKEAQYIIEGHYNTLLTPQ
jgi:uracil phosphoribosyltransferase